MSEEQENELGLSSEEEGDRLAELEERGLLIRPQVEGRRRFRAPLVPSRGKSASEMVIEDRRRTADDVFKVIGPWEGDSEEELRLLIRETRHGSKEPPTL